jgi:hypothetical protein
MLSLRRAARKLRYGAPVVVVSGLPRSGTSMGMKMLEAGGVTVLTDGIRTADVSNPKGYYELEAVKGLDKNGDTAWLREARGKAVKIISFLLTWLPEDNNYDVVFMQRDLDEVIASQNTMLVQRGEQTGSGSDDGLRQAYRQHLEKVMRFVSNRNCFNLLMVNYGDVLTRPEIEARRINDFLGGRLDVARMTAVADSTLYRNRAGVGPTSVGRTS